VRGNRNPNPNPHTVGVFLYPDTSQPAGPEKKVRLPGLAGGDVTLLLGEPIKGAAVDKVVENFFC